ncbi:TetR/AcrR family transcriptional regulator [Curtobacterium sp. 22159]|uniref:TetR/AcrR family transcriptional regulator n=1 Tax=Curtobacterium sp. 22159 TaxID=3453882 RepID=UPI003F87A886
MSLSMPGGEMPTPAPRKRGRPTEAERAQRRDDILDAAVRLFLAGGFEGVTLDAVAPAARVTKRTIYSYFGDRTDLFLAAVERLRNRALTPPEADEQLADLATHIVFTLHSDEAVGLHRLMIAESPRFPDLARRFYEDGPRRYIEALAAYSRSADVGQAEALFALLLGERHRQRLLGLLPAPTLPMAAAHAEDAIRRLADARGRNGGRPRTDR